jgi:DNA processing protein
MSEEELCAWLRLTLAQGVGNTTARRVLAAFGLPQAVFEQSSSNLQQVVSAAQANALLSEPAALQPLLHATLAWLAEEEDTAHGRRLIVTLGDPAYPASLLAMEDPPLLLYLQGQTQALITREASGATSAWPDRALAMVGSRNPTPQGAENARQFARSFSAAGLTVVSGLALGVDGAAHDGALSAWPGEDEPSGRICTVAVIGTGIDRVYPRQHHELARRITRQGLIVSEYPLGTPPIATNFPKRNRLIAGLSQGTLVVEAAPQSGSLITARLATEQGKEVFAIPGSIHNPQSRGCHALIRQGAKLVETAQDVLEELRWPASVNAINTEADHTHPASGTTSSESGDDVLLAMGADPVGLDALLARTGLDTARLLARLLELELEGHVARLPGGLVQRMARG